MSWKWSRHHCLENCESKVWYFLIFSAPRVPVSSAGSIGLQQQQQSQRYLFHIIDKSLSCPPDIKKPTLVSETSLVLFKPLQVSYTNISVNKSWIFPQQAWTMLWIEILMTWPQDCQGQFVGTNFQGVNPSFSGWKALPRGSTLSWTNTMTCWTGGR